MFFNKKKITMDVEVLFHTDSNLYGSHGEIVVTHKDHNYNNKVIRFVFKGMVHPPALTPQVLEYLFKQAEDSGYIPFEVIRYGSAINLTRVADAQLEDDKSKNDVLHSSMRRKEYLQALQCGYPHTFERWKNDVFPNAEKTSEAVQAPTTLKDQFAKTTGQLLNVFSVGQTPHGRATMFKNNAPDSETIPSK